jgi:hypothetical protein
MRIKPIPGRLTPLDVVRFLNSRGRRRRKRRDGDDEAGVPVKPDRPNTLSGGAAAALEFDE